MGLFQNFVHDRVNLVWFFPTVLHLDVFHDHAAFQRARSVQSRRRDDVFELVRFHLRQQVADTAGLELEDPLRLASLQQREGLGVCEVLLHANATELWIRLLHVVDGFVEDCQVA